MVQNSKRGQVLQSKMARRSGRVGRRAGLYGQQLDGRQGTHQHVHNLALNNNHVLAQHEVACNDALAFNHSIRRVSSLVSPGSGSFQDDTEAALTVTTVRTSQVWLLGLCVAVLALSAGHIYICVCTVDGHAVGDTSC